MKFAFIFPGQGSQKVGMGYEIYQNFAVAREFLESCSDECKIDFKKLLFTQNDKLDISEFTQPAIVLNSFMFFLALKQTVQIKQEFSFGHSLGEFSALGVNDGFDLVDTVKLVNLRGKLMQKACENKNASMMVVLGLDDEKVEKICLKARSEKFQIYPANYNCNGQIVVAGIKSDLEKFVSCFKDAGAKRAMLLNMSVASHCEILHPICDELGAEISVYIKDKFAKVISNVSAKFYENKEDGLNLLKNQLIKPVLYKQSVEFADSKVDAFVEFGSSVLGGLNKKITTKPTFSIIDLRTFDEFCKFTEEK